MTLLSKNYRIILIEEMSLKNHFSKWNQVSKRPDSFEIVEE